MTKSEGSVTLGHSGFRLSGLRRLNGTFELLVVRLRRLNGASFGFVEHTHAAAHRRDARALNPSPGTQGEGWVRACFESCRPRGLGVSPERLFLIEFNAKYPKNAEDAKEDARAEPHFTLASLAASSMGEMHRSGKTPKPREITPRRSSAAAASASPSSPVPRVRPALAADRRERYLVVRSPMVRRPLIDLTLALPYEQ